MALLTGGGHHSICRGPNRTKRQREVRFAPCLLAVVETVTLAPSVLALRPLTTPSEGGLWGFYNHVNIYIYTYTYIII